MVGPLLDGAYKPFEAQGGSLPEIRIENDYVNIPQLRAPSIATVDIDVPGVQRPQGRQPATSGARF